MANNVATKGFAYRLGHGLGSAVACVRAGEHRVLASAGRVGVPFRLMVKALLLAIKLGVIAALVVALLPALSWLMSAVIGVVLLAGVAYLSMGLVMKAHTRLSDVMKWAESLILMGRRPVTTEYTLLESWKPH
ncbi:hypothetical protein I0E98_10695 [Pseudomonas lalucatii]|nr:hypothetical protein [Pseudomonas lalucatii]